MNAGDQITINKRKIASASEQAAAHAPLTLSERAIALTIDSVMDRLRVAEKKLLERESA